MTEQERMWRISCAIRAQSDIEFAEEFEADAMEAEAAGFPDVAAEALAEARERRVAAARNRRLARGLRS